MRFLLYGKTEKSVRDRADRSERCEDENEKEDRSRNWNETQERKEERTEKHRAIRERECGTLEKKPFDLCADEYPCICRGYEESGDVERHKQKRGQKTDNACHTHESNQRNADTDKRSAQN